MTKEVFYKKKFIIYKMSEYPDLTWIKLKKREVILNRAKDYYENIKKD